MHAEALNLLALLVQKYKILTQRLPLVSVRHLVTLLTFLREVHPVYLLYWFKNTNTAPGVSEDIGGSWKPALLLFPSVLALLVQMYKY
jgi:hypothetical protein